MFLKRAAIIACFIPALASAEPCADDSTFTFTLDNGFTQTCDWITLNDNRIENRRSSYCNRGNIKGACPVSCDACPCLDDPDYDFQVNWLENNVRCDWITARSFSTNKRRRNFCFDDYNSSVSSDIGHACLASCGFCLGGSGSNSPSTKPSASPSSSPTATPSNSPSTKPSASPSSSPTATPSVQPSISVQPTTLHTSKPSVSAKPSASPSTTPSISMNPTPLKSPQPSISMTPTISGTQRPSTSPTVSGTQRPSTSPSPTRLPSKPPTMAPIDGCSDDRVFQFTRDNNMKADCDWLLRGNDSLRISKYCGRGHIKTGCSASCQFCTCENDPDFTFVTTYTKITVNCEWFLENNTIARQHKYCFQEGTVDASEIGSACVKSCGYCTNQ